jgi:hypothetical protein
VVTDANGNILYVHGDTGHYLRPAPGQATLNIVGMARERVCKWNCAPLSMPQPVKKRPMQRA